MGVIYCNRCTLGMHYTDVCPGGANGYPAKTKQQIRREYLQLWAITLGCMAVILTFTFWLVTEVIP